MCNFRTSTMTTMLIHGSRSTRTNILHLLTKDQKVSLQLMMLVLLVFRNVKWSNVNTTLVLMLTSRWATQKHCSFLLNKTGKYPLQRILVDNLNIIHWILKYLITNSYMRHPKTFATTHCTKQVNIPRYEYYLSMKSNFR